MQLKYKYLYILIIIYMFFIIIIFYNTIIFTIKTILLNLYECPININNNKITFC